jgi:DNA-binding transcriptional regulator YhcF (GntR family)
MPVNIFEYATRNKLRVPSARGELTTEQLWDVPLRSRDDFNLNAVAKTASKAWKDLSEESFVETARTPEHTRRETALEVVKYVIDAKLAEEVAAKKRADNKVEKEKLLAILAEKQDGKLSELSEKELQRRIAALGE